MTGEELKQYIQQSGMKIADIAREMNTTPQNFGAKLTRKSVRVDVVKAVKDIIDRCAPPLPIEMETAVLGSNINGSYSPNVQQSTGNNAALEAENKLLKQQNQFLQQQVERLTSLLGNK